MRLNMDMLNLIFSKLFILTIFINVQFTVGKFKHLLSDFVKIII